MRRGQVVGLTAAAAVLLSAVAGGGAAQAAQRPDPFTKSAPPASGTMKTAALQPVPSACTVKSYAPTKIVMGASKVTKTFSVTVKGCKLDLWSVVVWPFYDGDPLSTSGAAGNYWYWDQNEAGDDVKVQLRAKISLSPKELSNSFAGRWPDGAYVRAYGEEDRAAEVADENVMVEWATADQSLTLLRRATFGSSFNASPEPVKKGKKIKIKGKLARVNWNGAQKLKYVGFTGKVKVQFKANGTSKYVTKKSVRPTSKGTISTTVKATKSGRWRLYFPGWSTTAAATSKSDAVKVKS